MELATLGPQVEWKDGITEHQIDQMRVHAHNRKLAEELQRKGTQKRKRFEFK